MSSCYTQPSVTHFAIVKKTRSALLHQKIKYFQLIVNFITDVPKYMERFILNHSLSTAHKVIEILEKYLMYKNSLLVCKITVSLVSLILHEEGLFC